MDKKEKKKIIIFTVSIVGLISGGLLVNFLLALIYNTKQPIGIVMSDSMTPNLNKGDVIFTKGVEPEKIHIGDILVFNASGLYEEAPLGPVVHRVIWKVKDNDTWYVQTKGDANSWLDGNLIPEDRFIGVVFARVPFLGLIAVFLIETHFLVSACIVFLFIYGSYYALRKLPRVLR